MSRSVYRGDLSRPVPIPEAAIARAVDILRTGRLHRYDETRGGESETAALEQEFARALGRRFAVAVNSGGAALFMALKAAGLQPGGKVLTNAFTLAPVPGSIAHAGGIPVFVGTTPDLTIDLNDLQSKIETAGARILMLSHMRGHLADLAAVAEICRSRGVSLIEDCAHTWGAEWDGRPTGTFGTAGCFSAQSFKHMNAGEGGLLVTDDEELAARAIILSGSYMFYQSHGAAPGPEAFKDIRLDTPNCSMRMTELAAALLRPQLQMIGEWREDWNKSYQQLAQELAQVPHIRIPRLPEKALRVASSLQFLVTELAHPTLSEFIDEADRHGVHIKWFGRHTPAGFTSRYPHWRYAGKQHLPQTTDDVLSRVCDIRIPLQLPEKDIFLIVEVIQQAMEAALARAEPFQAAG